ncbi:unnamed protein product, partial [marine sediment metagenome]
RPSAMVVEAFEAIVEMRGAMVSGVKVAVSSSSHGPRISPRFKWVSTAALATIIVCALSGLPGGI